MSNPNASMPYVQALGGEITETTLLSGDPLRARYIVDSFLEDMKQFNATRNMFSYTGIYKGKRISVAGTGMGCPSIGIYSHELIHLCGCKNLIRVGTAGALSRELKVRDMVFAMGACITSNYARLFGLPEDYSCIASYELSSKAVEKARTKGLICHVGNVLSSDIFYGPAKSVTGGMTWSDMRVLAVEMEAVALYSNAAAVGVNALRIVTISDSMATGEVTTTKERQTAFTNMMEVALSPA